MSYTKVVAALLIASQASVAFAQAEHVARESKSKAMGRTFAASVARAPNPECSHLHPWGAPETSAVDTNRSFFVCRDFEVRFDIGFKSPLWVAERLTRKTLPRNYAFSADTGFVSDPLLPPTVQPSASDYLKSEYVPHGVSTSSHYVNSRAGLQFSNSMPVHSDVRDGVLQKLEKTVMDVAKERGELIVVTGPIYYSRPFRLSNGVASVSGYGIAVPDAIFKILMDVKIGQSTAFLIPNKKGLADTDLYKYQVSVSRIEKLTKFNFNPRLSHSAATAFEGGSGFWELPERTLSPISLKP